MADEPKTVLLLHFDEPTDGVPPSDAMGNFDDFVPAASCTPPAVADGAVGKAREWLHAGASGDSLESHDTAGQSRLFRDWTIEAVVYVPWQTTNGDYVIVQRGTGASNNEVRVFGLRVVVTGAPSAPAVELQALWDESLGNPAAVDPATLDPPAGWWYLACTRRWVSATEVLVEYYLNGERVGSDTSPDGNIALNVANGGTVMVGSEGGTGNPVGFKIDELRVSRVRRTAEEIKLTHDLMFKYPALGYELVRAFQPPGVWSQDPSSRVQRELAVEGDALGWAWAVAEEVHGDWFPDRAARSLERWEGLCGLVALPMDSVETRRARVLAHLRTVAGFSVGKVKDAVYPLVAASQAGVKVVEVKNRFEEHPEIGGSLSFFTSQDGAGGGTEGTITNVGGSPGPETKFEFQTGDDARWDANVRKAVRARASLQPDLFDILPSYYLFKGSTSFGTDASLCWLRAKVTAVSLTTNGDRVGIGFFNFQTGAAVNFGIIRDSGTNKFFTEWIDPSTGTLSRTIGSAIPSTPFWLQITHLPQGAGYDCTAVTQDPETTYSPAVSYSNDISAAGAGIGNFWAQLFAASASSSSAGTSSFTLDDIQVACPSTVMTFLWYLYVSSPIAGADYDGAQALIERIKPAHTLATLIRTTAMLVNEDISQCNRDILADGGGPEGRVVLT
jgi:hypothetical protein